jgi:hypothetical protein
MHGKGNFRWPDNRVYNGDYVEGVKEGYGEYIWPDGTKYIG